MSRIGQRIKGLEDRIPSLPCNHPFGVMINPTDQEIEEYEAEIEACPMRDNHRGPGPSLTVIYHRTKESSSCPNCGDDR